MLKMFKDYKVYLSFIKIYIKERGAYNYLYYYITAENVELLEDIESCIYMGPISILKSDLIYDLHQYGILESH